MTTMPPPPPRDDPHITAWLDAHASSPETRRTYKTGITSWLDWLNTHSVPLTAATREDATAWVNHLRAQTPEPAPRTIARKTSTAASLHRWLIEGGLSDKSPFQYISRPKVDPEVGGYAALTAHDVSALLSAAEAAGERTYVAVAMLLYTAIRANELLGIRIEHIHDQHDHIVVRVRRKGGLRDEVPVPDLISDSVAALARGRSSGYLITRGTGSAPDGRWSYWMLLQAVKAAGDAARIDRTVTPHMLRATWATTAIAAGVPLAHVQDVMGHASPTTTRGYDRGRHKITGKITAVDAVARALSADNTKENRR